MATNCCTCYVEIEDPTKNFACSNNHALCSQCLENFVKVKIDMRTRNIACPEAECRENLDQARVVAHLPEELGLRLENTMKMIDNSDLRLCIKCPNLVLREGSNKVKCGACNAAFCFLHEDAHEGRSCPGESESIYSQLRASAWRAWHTKTCPACHQPIEKNGGCDHMTCRCGFEICWRCGGPYARNGRRGHSFDLFPRPGNLQYCCNDSKMWAKRVGVVAFGAPVVVAGLAVAAPLAVVAGTVLLTYRGLGNIAHAIRTYHARRPSVVARRQARLDLETEGVVCRSMSLANETRCRYCSEGIDCIHIMREGHCILCGHWALTSCQHVYINQHCMFCEQAEPGLIPEAPPLPPHLLIHRTHGVSSMPRRRLSLVARLDAHPLREEGMERLRAAARAEGSDEDVAPMSPTAAATMLAAGESARRLRAELLDHPNTRRMRAHAAAAASDPPSPSLPRSCAVAALVATMEPPVVTLL
eukprot:m.227436 g.227436  ORF g.227436 m.227436 type:complete len:474 (+) comp17212_c0_seq1:173-1594(+)